MIGDFIREIRELRGYSQDALAKALGVSQKTVSNWEADKDNPGAYSLLMLYEKFNVTPNELLGIGTTGETDGVARSGQPLTDPQKKLLSLFRRMSLRQQNELLNFAEFTVTKKERE
jgi:transcriptional regulator with XRE-family HTH domain